MTGPNFNMTEPIYIQIANWLEDKIISGQLKANEQLPSTTELSAALKINPATVLKGMNVLVDKGLVYKKRGLGMFVAESADNALKDQRRAAFYDKYVRTMLNEAERLGISRSELIELIGKGGMGNE